MGRHPTKPARFNTSRSLIRSYLLLFSLFFLICLGLGYATVNRYRPASTPGLSDSAIYYQLVTGWPSELSRPYMRCRILVPFLAKPFYQLARRFVPSIDPIAFGLLVSNSLFCALGACFLVGIGREVCGEPVVAMFGAALYLISFAVTNLVLAGLVDSGEACFMLALTWSLLKEKFWLLPVWAILGTLAKETFVPFSIVFATAWLLSGPQRSDRSKLKWVLVLSVIAITSLIILHSAVAGQIVWPWQIASEARADASFFPALVGSLTNRGFWYVFVWLLPLGLLGIRRIDHRWVLASLATTVVALLLGAWKDMSGTVARPLFNTIGPMLALSSAMFLTEMFRGPEVPSEN